MNYENKQIVIKRLSAWNDLFKTIFRSRARTRNHHNWGSRFGRRRAEMVGREPASLRELEAQAQRTVQLMQKHNTNTADSYSRAMELLREQYNMNFMILCDKCLGTHGQDEALAPER